MTKGLSVPPVKPSLADMIIAEILTKVGPLGADVLQQVLLFNDLLDGQRRCAGQWMRLDIESMWSTVLVIIRMTPTWYV
jgi:hypothetical protein